ncbi:hypothetical protein C8A00DRAFT_16357 [Chaetomidium leptoderma]|uniref:Uncharacterized protein n=1 Tax=Chaetomidium leptoderma TaxID=669021 RepID=A0AAN6VK54_9PEZI|nr:hypothetical protein C8A00DRAFT_16357 [Chaetomidium leptoderma]
MAVPDEHQGDSRQSCLSTPPPLSPPLPRLSINRLVALHPRERLLVHPFRWTDQQPALLGCYIHSRDKDATGAGARENAVAASPKADRLARFLARNLNCYFEDGQLATTVLKLLRPFGSRISIDYNRVAYLYFDRRSRASIGFCRLSVLIRRPVPKIITLVCLDYYDTILERQTYFNLLPNRLYYSDLPRLYRCYSLLKRYTPADPRKDPLLVALVIALAQKARRRHTTQPGPHPHSFTVRPLLSYPPPGSPLPFVIPPRLYYLESLGVENTN